jgi:single-stranded-DNA-specific exonuclease
MDIIWKETPRQDHAEAQLVRELGLHALTARLLTNRGLLDPDQAETFLRPSLSHLHDPFGLPDMDKAAHRIAEAARSGETIFIHGDYDVDGVTSTALYVRALTKLGAKVVYRVPHRHQDGYDLKARAIEWAHQQGASLIITTDCGIQAREAVSFANSLGMTVIVTDHHEPGETLPDAYAVVNPHRRDSSYPFPYLAGVGVAYKTMQAVTRLLKPEWENAFLQNFLDLVATGTVADVMPLLGENRVFAYYGLEALRRSKKVGLRSLLDGARIDLSKRLTTESVGYGIGPRINAVGRLDDAAIALDLLLTTDADEANRLVDRLNECNLERQQAQKRITAEAILRVVQQGLAKKPVVVVASQGWNAGVVGIVAGKLVEQFHRPAIVIGTNEDGSWGKGSARSIPALDIFKAISQCRDLLETCGGHAYAAGLSLTMDRFDDFYTKLCVYAEARLTPDDFRPQICLDAVVPPNPIDVSLLDEWDQLEPYGEANPAPHLASRSVKVCGKRRIGKDLSHLKLVVASGDSDTIHWQAECVAWGRALDWDDSIDSGDDIDIAYVPTINSYNGRRSVQLVIKDLRRATPVGTA